MTYYSRDIFIDILQDLKSTFSLESGFPIGSSFFIGSDFSEVQGLGLGFVKCHIYYLSSGIWGLYRLQQSNFYDLPCKIFPVFRVAPSTNTLSSWKYSKLLKLTFNRRPYKRTSIFHLWICLIFSALLTENSHFFEESS